MTRWHGFAVFLVSILCSQLAAAQPPNPPAPSPGVTGSGPRANIQVSPNGTIEVGGARGSDLDLTGDNLRGSFGASRSQSPGVVVPSPPALKLPGTGRNPLGAPNFGPSLPGGSSTRDELPRVTGDDIDVSTLILPRFRGRLGSGASPTSDSRSANESWRYRLFRGRWWYWQSSQTWVYWDGSQWQKYAQ